jgi:hypothetical protein
MPTIPTTENCQECLKTGVTARLNHDLGAGEYFCANGHRMKEIMAGAPMDDLPPAVPQSQVAQINTVADLLVAQDRLNAVLDRTVADIKSAVGVESQPPSKLPEEEIAQVVSASAGQPPIGLEFHPTSTPLPGGDALVIIKLPEVVVGALRAEAENQGKSWEEFLQEHLTLAIQDRGPAF